VSPKLGTDTNGARPPPDRYRSAALPFLITIATMLTLSIASLEILTAIRAYVEGEGLYSKGQKDAVYYLSRYVESRDDEDYSAYLDSIAKPLGDRDARVALSAVPPDLPRARAGFLAGANHPDDVPRLIWFFQLFHATPQFRHAIELWTEGDAYTARIVEIAAAVRRDPDRYRDPGQRAAVRAILQDVTVGITPRENEFSSTLGAAARQATRWLIGACAVFAAIIAAIGIEFARARLRERLAYESALRRSESRYRSLFASSHDAILVVQPNGAILDANPAAYQLFDVAPNGFGTCAELGLADERGAFGAGTGAEAWLAPRHDLTLRRRDEAFSAEVVLARFADSGGEPRISIAIRDTTERRRLEAAVAAESARRHLFLRNASDGVCILDEQGRVVEASDSFCRMLGLARDEALGRTPPDWDVRATEREAGVGAPVDRSGARSRFETFYRRKDGSSFEVEVHTEAFEAGRRPYLYCSARDITELRRLERALLDATNREQRRLGYDLHDELGQVLTGISMLTASLASAERAAGRPAATRLGELELLTRQAIGTCRSIAHGLSPLTYQGGDLVRALEEMVGLQRVGATGDCILDVSGTSPLRLGAEAADNLYRIAQEAVTNARRHAHARTIRVALDIRPASVRLEVEDDGIGIAEHADEGAGMGLGIMKFRAAVIGARLVIGRGKVRGTRLVCTCAQGTTES